MGQLYLFAVLGALLVSISGVYGIKDLLISRDPSNRKILLIIFVIVAIVCGGMSGIASLYLTQALEFIQGETTVNTEDLEAIDAETTKVIISLVIGYVSMGIYLILRKKKNSESNNSRWDLSDVGKNK